jgi:hypothetical protein
MTIAPRWRHDIADTVDVLQTRKFISNAATDVECASVLWTRVT